MTWVCVDILGMPPPRQGLETKSSFRSFPTQNIPDLGLVFFFHIKPAIFCSLCSTCSRTAQQESGLCGTAAPLSKSVEVCVDKWCYFVIFDHFFYLSRSLGWTYGKHWGCPKSHSELSVCFVGVISLQSYFFMRGVSIYTNACSKDVALTLQP